MSSAPSNPVPVTSAQLASELQGIFQAGLKEVAVTDATALPALYAQYSTSLAALLVQQAAGDPNVAKDFEDLQDQLTADIGAIGVEDQAIAEKQIGVFFNTIIAVGNSILLKAAIAAAASA